MLASDSPAAAPVTGEVIRLHEALQHVEEVAQAVAQKVRAVLREDPPQPLPAPHQAAGQPPG